MTQPKRHHYLPQSYLKEFCRDRFLWVFDREKKEFRKQTPINTCVEKDLYTMVFENGEKMREVEGILSLVESTSMPAITKVSRQSRLTEKEIGDICLFLSFLIVRLPKFLKFTKQQHEKQVLKLLEEKFPEFVEKVHLEVKDWFSLKTSLRLEEKFRNLLWRFDWCICWPPQNSSFVTSDNPFTIIPREPSAEKVGFLTPGALKVTPLSPRCCVVLEDQGLGIRYRRVPRKIVDGFNVHFAANSRRFVIARDELELRTAVKRAGLVE
ncbi:MAG TPA: DUF4238 domain-containing protein [Candidatus Deferrimicrobium sp.]|nr:DUF4238 domain-containing protein [Candidatus Deferrimicrobium sp.]